MIKYILIAVIGIVLIDSCALDKQRQKKENLPNYNEVKTNGHNKYSTLLRLYMSDSFCTGFVIDGNYAMTAAHCVTNIIGSIEEDTINVFDAYGLYIGKAKAVAIDKYQDIAFLKGDFTECTAALIDFEGKYSKKGMHLLACGFPAGMPTLYCAELVHVGNNYFKYRTIGGPIFKGMSGGPVFEMDSKAIIGVNSSVDEDTVIIGPVLGGLEGAGIR